MPRTHKPSRVDANQVEIVAALRKAGWEVAHLHMVGGIPDLLVSQKSTGITMLVEVKVPGGKLTPAEAKFCEDWPGEIVVVYSGEDAVSKVNERAECWERLPFSEPLEAV